jgi:ABC-2 type transport system ATP-binding protein
VLTTHYIEEAEEIADRVAVIHKGEIIVTDEKAALMRRMGKKSLTLELTEPLDAVPPGFADKALELSGDRLRLTYIYDSQAERTGITSLLADLREAGVRFHDINTHQSSLEDIFVDLVKDPS